MMPTTQAWGLKVSMCIGGTVHMTSGWVHYGRTGEAAHE